MSHHTLLHGIEALHPRPSETYTPTGILRRDHSKNARAKSIYLPTLEINFLKLSSVANCKLHVAASSISVFYQRRRIPTLTTAVISPVRLHAGADVPVDSERSIVILERSQKHKNTNCARHQLLTWHLPLHEDTTNLCPRRKMCSPSTSTC